MDDRLPMTEYWSGIRDFRKSKELTPQERAARVPALALLYVVGWGWEVHEFIQRRRVR